MSAGLPIESDPMTGSSAEFLASIYTDGGTLQDFANGLPPRARVVDFGAGTSPFGDEVISERNDVAWLNLDIQYPEQTVLSLEQNIRRQRGDVLEANGDHTYTLGLSYNLVPFIIRQGSRELGGQALRGMLSYLDDDGKLLVGPTKKQGIVELPATADEAALDDATKAMATSFGKMIVYNAMARSRVRLDRGKRFDDVDTKGLVVSVAEEEGHYKLFSPRGLRLAGRLAHAAVREVFRPLNRRF